VRDDELLKLLVRAAEEMAKAAVEARERWAGRLRGKDLERKIDYAAVDAFKSVVGEGVEGYYVISEEGFEKPPEGGRYILVDPVDGTSNMCRGIPFSAVSLAVSDGDTMDSVRIGVVRDIFRGAVYYAVRGRGAYKDGRRIRVGVGRRLSEAAVSVAVTRAVCGRSKVLEILPALPYPRYLGSASLEACLVAEGALDAYVDVRGLLRVFDVAAAQLIVREAGGRVLVTQNGSREVRLSRIGGVSIIAAATGELLDEIASVVGVGRVPTRF